MHAPLCERHAAQRIAPLPTPALESRLPTGDSPYQSGQLRRVLGGQIWTGAQAQVAARLDDLFAAPSVVRQALVMRACGRAAAQLNEQRSCGFDLDLLDFVFDFDLLNLDDLARPEVVLGEDVDPA